MRFWASQSGTRGARFVSFPACLRCDCHFFMAFIGFGDRSCFERDAGLFRYRYIIVPAFMAGRTTTSGTDP